MASVVTLLAVAGFACGGGGPSTQEQAGAEQGMREIETLLGSMLDAYRRGDKDQALRDARRAGHEIYETEEVEGVVAEVAPEVNRQFDSLIEATIPEAVEKGVALQELDGHVSRARGLITDALKRIDEKEQ